QPAVGRYGGPYRRLRALRGPRRAGGRRDEGPHVPGPGRQLRPLGLPGGVVPGIGAVHVPLPRRRLLRQRRARLRPAAARPLPLCLSRQPRSRAGRARDPGAALPDPAGHLATPGLIGPIHTRAPAMKRWLRTGGIWLDARLRVRATLLTMMKHPIPRGAAGPMGWWYVFGSASLTLLLLQILTGIGLALVYVPAADKAYESLLYLNCQETLGWFL